MRLRAGTLYSAQDRLRLDGLVRVDREEVVEGRLRRYYQLTAEGATNWPPKRPGSRPTRRPRWRGSVWRKE